MDEESRCPGYESVLEELMALTWTMNNPCKVGPTGVVLTGCAGLGKSRVASWFKRELSRVGSTSVTCVTVSAKDVHLDEASSWLDHCSLFDKGGIAHRSSDNGTWARNLLIIDDLDVIISDTHDTEPSSMNIRSDLESEHSTLSMQSSRL